MIIIVIVIIYILMAASSPISRPSPPPPHAPLSLTDPLPPSIYFSIYFSEKGRPFKVINQIWYINLQ